MVDKIIRGILCRTEKGKMQIRINTLELENATLKSVIKDDLYKRFMDKLGEPEELKRLRADNKKLRVENRNLKFVIKQASKEKIEKEKQRCCKNIKKQKKEEENNGVRY